mmetsp:Transcript_10391/g.12922  ORF Transcript_10391/g.12922 Transcript_10391/m.12922 type:complete len:236 (+) Transcript_10391:486-1193(+)
MAEALIPVNVIQGKKSTYVGDYSGNDIVMGIKDTYAILNHKIWQKKSLSDMVFKFNGKIMNDTDKIRCYTKNINLRRGLVIKCEIKVLGPDVKKDVIQQKWSDTAPIYRRCTQGFNVEFEYKGHDCIGQLGYGTFNFSIPSHLKKAKCLFKDGYSQEETICLPNLDSIKDFWFTNCIVTFIGYDTNDNLVNTEKTYDDLANRHEGDAVEYRSLILQVNKIPENLEDATQEQIDQF